MARLLEVTDLSVEFQARGEQLRVVDSLSFHVDEGEILGIVGESGSGKSMTMLALLNLVPNPGRVATGTVLFRGEDVLRMSGSELRALRGDRIAIIPSDASSTLNPVLRIGMQVAEVELNHRESQDGKGAYQRAIDMLGRVHLPNPESRARQFPHELSGGMQQRSLIAMGLTMSPDLLIADEPTTALDVTIQAQILALLSEIRNATGAAVLFVTHDLAVVSEICDRVLVMYAGRIVESVPVGDLLAPGRHPYTRALIDAIPPLGGDPPEELPSIPGAPPEPGSWSHGCRFAPRCPLRLARGNPEICDAVDPPLREGSAGHAVACHLLDPAPAGPGEVV